jgi:hypothetical protein
MSDYQDNIDFLRMFFRSYIPPFIQAIPQAKEDYEKIFLRSQEIWGHLYRMIDRVPLPLDIKKKMIELFATSKEVWVLYLVADAHREHYLSFKMKREVQDKWRKMKGLAQQIENFVQRHSEFQEPTPLNV